MLKRQKIGIVIFAILLLTGVSLFFSDFLIKSEYTELDLLLIPSILLGLIFSAYELSKKAKSDVGIDYSNKSLYYLFCEHFLMGAGIPLTLISSYYTYGYALFKFKCLFDSSNSCQIDISGYYLFYTTLFLIVAYGFHKKLMNDRSERESEWQERLNWKEKRIQELGQKLKKSQYTNERVVDWEFLDEECEQRNGK